MLMFATWRGVCCGLRLSCMDLALGFQFGKFQVDQILKKFMVKLIAHYSIG